MHSGARSLGPHAVPGTKAAIYKVSDLTILTSPCDNK